MSTPDARPEIVITKDGSMSLYTAAFNQHYHSIHGAMQESMHVFIQMGLHALSERKQPIRVLEMGLGTGLYVLLTCREAEQLGLEIAYTAIEQYPLEPEIAQQLNYAEEMGEGPWQEVLQKIHDLPWQKQMPVHAGLSLEKVNGDLLAYAPSEGFDLIYYDAFAPESQPELWTPEVMAQLFAYSNPGAIWVSYCAKGSVRRALLSAGYEVEKVPGPPGKREMLRGRKPKEKQEEA